MHYHGIVLAILADHLGEEPTREALSGMRSQDFISWRLHQDFKFAFVTRFPEASRKLTASEIAEWLRPRLEEIEREQRKWGESE